jgi:hypothetical protein
MILRRTAEELTEEERRTLEASFPGVELKLFSHSPPDHERHVLACDWHCPDLVLLPGEVPIPLTAMKAGFRHVTVID